MWLHTMGRGTSGYVSYTALVLLCRVSRTSAGLWDVSIDESPAPPPGAGPPFSANATRNLDLLPYQVIGVVGAYIGSILILGSLLLTVGRTLRKKAQEMALQPKELVQPLSKAFERTPVSPDSSRNWYSPRRMMKRSTGSMRSPDSAGASPAVASIASFDTNVIEADKLKRHQEMERLYAAVMAQDEQRSGLRPNVTALPPITTPEKPPEYSTKNPPKIITDDPTLRYLQAANPNAPTPQTPKSPVRAIYPPDGNLPPGPASPTSPIRAEYSPWPQPSRPSLPDRAHSHDREHSFGSAQTIVGSSAGPASPKKKLHKSIKNLKISAPIVRVDNEDDARTPLSPRFYADPGVPPEPPTAGTSRSYGYPPTTPGTAVTQRSYGWEGDEIEEDMDQIRDLPLANPQRYPVNPYVNEAQMVTDLASTRPDPSRNRAVGNGSLPLREMNRQYALLQAQQQHQQTQQRPSPNSPAAQQAAFPLSPTRWNNPTSPSHAYVTSAGPVKTTFLEARNDRNARGPLTGVPTPYSAYMPFTPLTPITPHLTTRAERKQREKDEKRTGAARKPILEEEAVVEEKEMWSYAY